MQLGRYAHKVRRKYWYLLAVSVIVGKLNVYFDYNKTYIITLLYFTSIYHYEEGNLVFQTGSQNSPTYHTCLSTLVLVCKHQLACE